MIQRRKWVTSIKKLTIQFVGPVCKQFALVTTRALEAWFRASKSSLWGSVYVVWHGKIPRGVHVEIECLRLGLLKVKPSLRDSIFKPSHRPLARLGHVHVFCLFWACREYLTSTVLGMHWSYPCFVFGWLVMSIFMSILNMQSLSE